MADLDLIMVKEKTSLFVAEALNPFNIVENESFKDLLIVSCKEHC